MKIRKKYTISKELEEELASVGFLDDFKKIVNKTLKDSMKQEKILIQNKQNFEES
jgi:hypothetical protein